jgi:hypothetical protein
MSKSIKDSMHISGYDPEEVYFFEENRRKIIEMRKSRGMSDEDAVALDARVASGGGSAEIIPFPSKARDRKTKKAA